MKSVIHTVCGDVAFNYTGPTAPTDIVRPELATYPDGTKPMLCDRFVCGACKKPIASITDLMVKQYER